MIDKAENGITEGKIVLYTFEAKGTIVTRPAIIVNVWKDSAYQQGEVNLQVFTDFQNDELNPVEWRTSVPYSTEGVVNSYRFLEDAVTVPQPPAPPQPEERAPDQQAAQAGDASQAAQTEDNTQTGTTEGNQQTAPQQ